MTARRMIDELRDALRRLSNRIDPGRRPVDDFWKAGDRRGVRPSRPGGLDGRPRGGAALLIVERVVRVAEMKILRQAAKCLRVAEKQKPTRNERQANTLHDLAHRLGREVHDDVAAEDNVVACRRPKRRVRVEEIPLLEADHRLHVRIEDEVATLGAEVATANVVGCRS